MALRLRRGTNAERLLITPVEGELIYTTDTKLLYVGDGSTVGGTLVTGSGSGGAVTLDGLTDVSTAGVTDNQVLTWIAGNNQWEPTTIPGAGSIDIGDLGDVFAATPSFHDILYFDGLNWVNGDGSWIAGQTSLDDLIDVAATSPGTNQVLTFNSVNWVPSTIEDLLRFSSLEVDVKGSVFGNDSTMLVNGLDSKITGPVETTSVNVSSDIVIEGTGGLTINTNQNADDAFNLFNINASKESDVGSSVVFTRSRGTLAAPTSLIDGDEILGINYFGYDSDDAPAVAAVIQVAVDGTVASGAVPGSILLATADAAGTPSPALVINSAQQTTLYGAVTLANYADDTARDAAITAPVLGMMIFHVANDTAQVYKSTGWTNL